MRVSWTRGLQAFRRGVAWFVDRPEVIPATGPSAPALTTAVTALTGVIDRITAAETEQAHQSTQTTLKGTGEDALRESLRATHMRGIVTMARSVRSQVPGVSVFKMPAANASPETLVRAAQELHTSAAVYKDVFIEKGLPSDFLDQLATATSALKASIDARGIAKSRRVAAGDSIRADLALGREILQSIDATLLHALASQPAVLASWKQARRVTKKGVLPPVTTQPSPATGTTSVASSPAPAPESKTA